MILDNFSKYMLCIAALSYMFKRNPRIQRVIGCIFGLSMLFALFTGCGAGLGVNPDLEVSAPAGVDAAMTTVLRVYGKPGFKPRVHWYGASAQACGGVCPSDTGFAGMRWRGYISASLDQCVAGETYDGESIVMAPIDGYPLWSTTLAHELAHASMGITDHPVAIFGHDPTVCGAGFGGILHDAILAMDN